MPRRVVMLVSNPYRPDPRVHKEARVLVSNGYSVTVIAWDRELRFPRKEEIDGVRVLRIRVPGSYDDFLSQAFRLPQFWARAFFEMMSMRWDIVHCHDLDTLPIGLYAAWLRRESPVVFDSHELYTLMVEKSTPRLMLMLIQYLEGLVVKRAETVVTVNQVLGDYFKRRRAKRVDLVMNCSDPAEVPSSKRDEVRRELGCGDAFLISYIGTVSPGRLVVQLAKWAKRLGPGYSTVIGGTGTDSEAVEREASGSGNLRYLGQVPMDRANEITAASDAVVALFDTSDRNNLVITPIKMFDAMSLGVPVVITGGVAGASIVENEGAGIVIENTLGSFSAALERLRGDRDLAAEMGAMGRSAAEREYNWTSMSQRLLRVYEDLLGENSFK